MMSPDGNTPIRGAGKNGKTEPPAKKAAKRSRKPSHKEAAQKETAQKEAVQRETVQRETVQRETVQEEAIQKEASPKELAQQAAPETEQLEQPQEPIAVATVAMENPSADAAPEAAAPIAPAEEPAEAAPREPEQAVAVDLQTISNAYGDFTRKSIEQTGSFFEQLAGARSLSRAFELQGEFAKQTCETFFAESRKIRELHSELAMQRWRNFEGFMAWMKPTRPR